MCSAQLCWIYIISALNNIKSRLAKIHEGRKRVGTSLGTAAATSTNKQKPKRNKVNWTSLLDYLYSCSLICLSGTFMYN